MISRAPSRAMSSITSPSSRSPPNRASISARIFSVGDTRTDTGVVLPSVSLVALEGTYVRCHLHQRRDTTAHYTGGDQPMSPLNYVWYQYRWQRLAARMF